MTPGSSYNEQILVQEMSQGSQSAFDTLYLHYFQQLVTHVTEITKDTAIAEDIVQDTFLTLWQKRTTFAKYDKIAGWLFISTHNRAINYLRRLAKEKQRLATIAHQDDTDIKTIEEQYRLVEETIAKLPTQRKKVFELCKLEGLTYDEAAEQLNISRNTVKDHLKKAAESIKQHITSTKGSPLSKMIMLFITCI